MDFRIAVLPGDGIGPEVTAAAVRVLEALGKRFGHRFSLSYADVGGDAIDKYGTALPSATLELCRQSEAVLFGAVGGPKWDDPRAKVRPEDGILGLRKGLGLFANLRPVKTYPQLLDATAIKPAVLAGTDLVVIRELTGGLYFAKPKRRYETKGGRSAVDTLRYTETEVQRIVQVGFELARRRRQKLTSVDKANVLTSSRLWREIATEIGKGYPDVALEHVLVDSCAMHLVRRPASFDVIVTENMFGDILTDEASVLAGSMGMLPSASLAGLPTQGRRALGLYEPIHGSAPDIAGQGKANPIGSILSVAMLLRHSLALEQEAQAIEKAVAAVIEAGVRTPDIAGPGDQPVGTEPMTQAILDVLAKSGPQ